MPNGNFNPKSRIELETRVLAAALKQSFELGDSEGVTLAHRQLVLVMKDKGNGGGGNPTTTAETPVEPSMSDQGSIAEPADSDEAAEISEPAQQTIADQPPAEAASEDNGDARQDVEPVLANQAKVTDSGFSHVPVPSKDEWGRVSRTFESYQFDENGELIKVEKLPDREASSATPNVKEWEPQVFDGKTALSEQRLATTFGSTDEAEPNLDEAVEEAQFEPPMAFEYTDYSSQQPEEQSDESEEQSDESEIDFTSQQQAASLVEPEEFSPLPSEGYQSFAEVPPPVEQEESTVSAAQSEEFLHHPPEDYSLSPVELDELPPQRAEHYSSPPVELDELPPQRPEPYSSPAAQSHESFQLDSDDHSRSAGQAELAGQSAQPPPRQVPVFTPPDLGSLGSSGEFGAQQQEEYTGFGAQRVSQNPVGSAPDAFSAIQEQALSAPSFYKPEKAPSIEEEIEQPQTFSWGPQTDVSVAQEPEESDAHPEPQELEGIDAHSEPQELEGIDAHPEPQEPESSDADAEPEEPEHSEVSAPQVVPEEVGTRNLFEQMQQFTGAASDEGSGYGNDLSVGSGMAAEDLQPLSFDADTAPPPLTSKAPAVPQTESNEWVEVSTGTFQTVAPKIPNQADTRLPQAPKAPSPPGAGSAQAAPAQAAQAGALAQTHPAQVAPPAQTPSVAPAQAAVPAQTPSVAQAQAAVPAQTPSVAPAQAVVPAQAAAPTQTPAQAAAVSQRPPAQAVAAQSASATAYGAPESDLSQAAARSADAEITEAEEAQSLEIPRPENMYALLGVSQMSPQREIHKSCLCKTRKVLRELKGKARPERDVLLKQLRKLWIAHDILVDPVTRTDYDFRELGLRGVDGNYIPIPEDSQRGGIGSRTPLRIGELLQCAGLLEMAELEIACDMHKAMPEVQFGTFLVKQGFIQERDLDSVLLGQRLLRDGKITVAQFQVAMELSQSRGVPISDILIEHGYLTAEELVPQEVHEERGEPPDSVPSIREVPVRPKAPELMRAELNQGKSVPTWKDQLDWSRPIEVVDDHPVSRAADKQGLAGLLGGGAQAESKSPQGEVYSNWQDRFDWEKPDEYATPPIPEVVPEVTVMPSAKWHEQFDWTKPEEYIEEKTSSEQEPHVPIEMFEPAEEEARQDEDHDESADLQPVNVDEGGKPQTAVTPDMVQESVPVIPAVHPATTRSESSKKRPFKNKKAADTTTEVESKKEAESKRDKKKKRR